MGLKDLFRKEHTCEKCGIVFQKSGLAVYDSTHQGKNRNGYSMKVCGNCILDMFYEDIRSFNDLAIVISPIKKFNAFVTYDFETLLNARQNSRSSKLSNDKFVNGLKDLLPLTNTKCSDCGNVASFTWCSPEIVRNDPFTWELRNDSEFQHKYLCKECMIREFGKVIKEGDIKLEFIYPPIKGDGLLCSWEL